MTEHTPRAGLRAGILGEQPLHWVWLDGCLLAAWSAARLSAAMGQGLRLDPAAAAAALGGELASGRSLFEGIRRLRAGHELFPGPPPAVRRYWRPPVRPARAGPADALARELRRRLEAALDAPRVEAVALSGGLDSSALLALAAAAGARPRAFTLADRAAGGAELRACARLAARFGVEHALVEVAERDLPDHFAAAVRACEEPLWNGRAVARLLFFRALRAAGVRALATGTGADEVLCGDPAGLAAWDRRRREEGGWARSLLLPRWRGALPAALPRPPAGVPPLVWRQHQFLRRALPASTLPPECRLSAALGLEVRLPYLHPAVARFALTLPERLRVRGGRGKWLLREAMKGALPEAVRLAPKTARLAAPGGEGPLRARWLALYDHLLAPARLRGLGLVQPSRVRGALDELARQRGDDPRRPALDAVLMRLASLVVLDEWMRGAGPPAL